MIPKLLPEIEFPDIKQLLSESIPEGATIEYKRDNYGSTDRDKKELLKDVCSFANTKGGDLLIGVDEDSGIPISIPGIVVEDVDSESLRFEQVIRAGLQPRIDFSVRFITTGLERKYVAIIRIEKSIISPHRVVFQSRPGEFWARKTGAYSMDVEELRRAFTLSETVYDRIAQFSKSRIDKFISGDAGQQIKAIHSKRRAIMLHCIPEQSFTTQTRFDVTANEIQVAFSISEMPEQKVNFDGFMRYYERVCYAQLFRNGAVEIASSVPFVSTNLEANQYEEEFVNSLQEILQCYHRIDINVPIWCFFSVIGGKGFKIDVSSFRLLQRFGEVHHIEDDVLRTPEILIDDLKMNTREVLLPAFDLIWNACGIPRSPNFENIR